MAELVDPHVRYRESFGEAMDEFRAEGRGGPDDPTVIGWYVREHPEAWLDDGAFGAFVDEILAERLEDPARPEFLVPDTELWWVEGDEFLGRIAVRHRLTPALFERGGHIGYDVRPTARRRGHATAMLREALKVAADLSIERALITCHVTNIGSRRVIELNGGVLADENEGVLRFWAPTASKSHYVKSTKYEDA